MKIRKATSADISTMMDLERSSATAGHWTEAQYRNLFDSRERRLERLTLVADATSTQPGSATRNSILGFLVARNVGPEWELENIVVAASDQRRGIGAQLVHALLTEARQTDNAAVFLEVRESNAAARALYEKSGFSQVGRRKAYYSDPREDAVLYRWMGETRPFS